MTRDDIIRMAREVDLHERVKDGVGYVVRIPNLEKLERFAALVAAAEREKVAAWMHFNDYTTGHGDTTEDLLKELEWQVAEREREGCAKVCESEAAKLGQSRDALAIGICAAAIRARGET